MARPSSGGEGVNLRSEGGKGTSTGCDRGGGPRDPATGMYKEGKIRSYGDFSPEKKKREGLTHDTKGGTINRKSSSGKKTKRGGRQKLQGKRVIRWVPSGAIFN